VAAALVAAVAARGAASSDSSAMHRGAGLRRSGVGAVACVEVQQLELSLQLLSLRFRSAALEEVWAVADPG